MLYLEPLANAAVPATHVTSAATTTAGDNDAPDLVFPNHHMAALYCVASQVDTPSTALVALSTLLFL